MTTTPASNQPIVAIFSGNRKETELLFSEKAEGEHYEQAYLELLEELTRQGAFACVVRGQSSYKGRKVFADYWLPNPQKRFSYKKVDQPISVDALLNKKSFSGDGHVNVLNPEHVFSITSNKKETYLHFSEFQPSSTIVESKRALKNQISNYAGDNGLLVVKSLFGSGGKEVYIDTPENVLKHNLPEYPLLVQSFVDSSDGIEGIARSYHDVRVYILGGEIIGGALRQPIEPGEYRSNTYLGGEIRLLKTSELPATLKQFARKIDSKFTPYARFYTADFLQKKNQWFLIELNSKPGLCARYQGEVGINFQQKLADYLINLARQKPSKYTS